MIVKVQLPLMKGDGALAFNKDKSFHREIPLRPALLQRMGDHRRAFFNAEVVDGGSLELAEILPDQGW